MKLETGHSTYYPPRATKVLTLTTGSGFFNSFSQGLGSSPGGPCEWSVFSRGDWCQCPSRVPQAREPEKPGLTDGDHRSLCDVLFCNHLGVGYNYTFQFTHVLAITHVCTDFKSK
jgi:hypothetical protein